MPKIVVYAAVAVLLATDAPGSALTSGMQLQYSVTDRDSLTWSVVSVADTTIGGLTSCRAIVLRLPDGLSERRNWCAAGDIVLAWDTLTHALRPNRPIGEGMSLDAPGDHGARLSYSTRSALDQAVGGRRFKVIETIAVNRDSNGRPVQRWREFFAPALAMPTGGVLEVPDSGRAGNWRIQTSYKLVRIAP